MCLRLGVFDHERHILILTPASVLYNLSIAHRTVEVLLTARCLTESQIRLAPKRKQCEPNMPFGAGSSALHWLRYRSIAIEV